MDSVPTLSNNLPVQSSQDCDLQPVRLTVVLMFGRVRIPIKDLPEDEEQDLWLDVEDPKEAVGL